MIVHGWGGNSESDWLPWLAHEMKRRGATVIVPDMPGTDEPVMGRWIPFLNDLVKEPDQDTYFVGHSIGCQTILRYLESLPAGKKVGGVVLVAGWMTLRNLSEEEKPIAKPWIETPIDWAEVNSHCDFFTAVYSDDDPYVPESDARLLGDRLRAKLVLDSKKGHFTDEDDVAQLPAALNELLVIMGMPVDTPAL